MDITFSLVIPGGDILCRRDSGNGDKFFCAPDALRPPRSSNEPDGGTILDLSKRSRDRGSGANQ